MLALEHEPECEVTIFYNDIRTSGKGFEELYLRAQAAGVRFIKGLPGRIQAGDDGRPVICFEDQERGGRGELAVDMAVLAVGLEASGEPLPFVDLAPARDGLGFYQDAPPHPAPPGVHPAGGLSGRHLPGAPGHLRDRVPGERGGGPGHPPVDRSGREKLSASGPDLIKVDSHKVTLYIQASGYPSGFNGEDG